MIRRSYALAKYSSILPLLRRFAWSISPIISALIFAALLFGAIAKGIETRDFLIFGEKGVVFCVAGQDGAQTNPDHSPQAHHALDCCVLCAVDHTIRFVAIELLPFVSVYDLHFRPYQFKIHFFNAPPIALTDGVFPHDIPVRAPPFSFA